VWGDIIPRPDIPVTLRALAGCRGASGRCEILVTAHPNQEHGYLLPAPNLVGTSDGATTWPEGFLDFHSHGAGFVVTVDQREAMRGDGGLVDFRYILTPAARQIDEDRFLAGDDNSIIEAVVARAIEQRTGRLPVVSAIGRLAQPRHSEIYYRILEADGSRHFFSLAPQNDTVLEGIVHIETVPLEMPSPAAPHDHPHSHVIIERFDSYYREIGFTPVSLPAVEKAFPSFKAELSSLIARLFPGDIPARRIAFHHGVKSREETILFIGLHDEGMRSFVPTNHADRYIVDPSLSGLIVALHHPSAERAPGLWAQARSIAARFLSPRGHALRRLNLEIMGPSISDSAWLDLLHYAHRSPRSNFLTEAITAAIAHDLNPTGRHLLPTDIGKVTPIRTALGRDFWDKHIVCVDHRYGTHILEIPRQRSTGLVHLNSISVQQRFLNTPSHGEL
jgi:hypothetical protein